MRRKWIMLLAPPVAAALLFTGVAGAREPVPYGTGPSAQVSQQGMLDMLNEMEQLRREVQQMRGELEMQSHTIEQMRGQQRQQYVDIDRRLNRLETGPGAAQVPEAIAPAPALVPPVERPPEINYPVPVVSQPEPTHVVRQPAPDSTAIGSVADRIAYNEAKGLLNDSQYAPAVDAFRKFLVTYPASPFADNAQYWLAETFYKTRQFKAALDEFLVVVEKYPTSLKALDAKLKIGFIYYELQDWQPARLALAEVIRQAPSSSAARLAQHRLERMDREGHR